MLKSATTQPRFSKILIALGLTGAFVVGVTGCSKNSDKGTGTHRAVIASPSTPLTAEQTVQFKKVLGSMGQLNSLGLELQKDMKGKKIRSAGPSNQMLLQAMSAFAQNGAFGPNGTTPSGGQDSLKNRVENGDCSINLTLPKDSPDEMNAGSQSIPTMGVEITGAACPMRYKVLVSGNQDQKTGSIAVTISLAYDAVTDEARKMNDIDHMTYTGTMLINIAQVQAGDTVTMSMAMEVHLDAAGHSQVQGDFIGQNDVSQSMVTKMSGVTSKLTNQTLNSVLGKSAFDKVATLSQFSTQLSANQMPSNPFPGMSITGTLKSRDVYQFPSFTGELAQTAVIDGLAQPKSTYTLNGQQITAEQFAAYQKMIRVPGSNPADDGSSSGPTGGPISTTPRLPLFCDIIVNVPTPGSTPHPMAFSSCGQEIQQSGNFMNHNIDVKIMPMNGYMELSATVCQNGACRTETRDFSPNETKAFENVGVLDSAVSFKCSYDQNCGSSL